MLLNQRRLARADMMLRQQPAWKGIEVELNGDIPAFLLAARLPRIRPQIDPMDTDREMRQEMENVSRALPPLRAEQEDKGEPVRYTRKKPTPVKVQLLPEALAIERLAKHVLASDKDTSLLEWRSTDQDALAIDPGLWVTFATQSLRSRNLTVALVKAPPRPGERFRHYFTDARALPGRQHLQR